MSIDGLNRQFAIPGVAAFEQGEGGLTKIVMSAAGSLAEAYLLGGHVTSWAPAGGKDVLWLSRLSRYAIGQPIRGGIPVCHPWFGALEGNESAPMHGYVRLMPLDVESVELCEDGGVTAVLGAKFSQPAGVNWPSDFEIRLHITAGRSLSVAVETVNCGQADLVLSEALHSYFRVSDVRNVSVTGLAGQAYWRQVAGGEGVQGPEPLTLTAQTDRVYKHSTAAVEIHDPHLGRTIRIAKRGSRSTVVWNPRIEKAAAMDDFGDDEWPEMLCIEAANALDDAVTVPPGEAHVMEMRISVGTS